MLFFVASVEKNAVNLFNTLPWFDHFNPFNLSQPPST